MKDCFALSYDEIDHPSELLQFTLYKMQRVFKIDCDDREVYGPTLRPILIGDCDVFGQLVVAADKHWFVDDCRHYMGHTWQDLYNALHNYQLRSSENLEGSSAWFEVIGSRRDRCKCKIFKKWSSAGRDVYLSKLHRGDMQHYGLTEKEWKQEVAAAKERIVAEQAGAAS